MGQEIDCRMHYREQTFAGKAYLETDFLLFRGDERLQVPFKEMTKVDAAGGILRLEFEGGPAEFELGDAAAKWADKILHPPTRMHKLGVKPGMAVRVVGRFGDDFLADLADSHIEPTEASADLIFLAAESKAKLYLVARLARTLKPGGAIWVIYPRGIQKIREIDVIQTGRKADLKDVKVASFSLSHTALKFMFPRIQRRSPA